ncbi:hypothetical protein MLD38_040760 [Melastoma candidum]|nr:hypothetical protein MLD38_040760 [Melastoma candidum]
MPSSVSRCNQIRDQGSAGGFQSPPDCATEGYEQGVGYGVLIRKAVQVENLFLDFLKSFRADTDSGGGGPPHYESEVEAMKANESSIVFVDFSHVMTFSEPLESTISEEYL